jgi:transcriptional regulator with XRE-family HTH domain
MGQSSIRQLPLTRRLSEQFDGAIRLGLGRELRRRRVERGLTQGALGAPLSKGFVSAVERGRVVPSLPALQLMVDRLGITLSDFFADVEQTGVERHLTAGYHRLHELDADPHAPQGGR